MDKKLSIAERLAGSIKLDDPKLIDEIIDGAHAQNTGQATVALDGDVVDLDYHLGSQLNHWAGPPSGVDHFIGGEHIRFDSCSGPACRGPTPAGARAGVRAPAWDGVAVVGMKSGERGEGGGRAPAGNGRRSGDDHRLTDTPWIS
jgi:hypothetical protein